MKTEKILKEFVKEDKVIEFSIQYILSTNFGFDYCDLLTHLPRNVKNEEELLEHIKEYIMKSEFVKEVDEFNTLIEISNVEFD